MEIDSTAVEAAARARYEFDANASDGFDAWPKWEALGPDIHAAFYEDERHHLAAALPHLERALLDRLIADAETGPVAHYAWANANEYVAEWLRARREPPVSG